MQSGISRSITFLARGVADHAAQLDVALEHQHRALYARQKLAGVHCREPMSGETRIPKRGVDAIETSGAHPSLALGGHSLSDLSPGSLHFVQPLADMLRLAFMITEASIDALIDRPVSWLMKWSERRRQTFFAKVKEGFREFPASGKLGAQKNVSDQGQGGVDARRHSRAVAS